MANITWTGIELLEQARYANGSFGDGITMSAEEVSDDLIALNMLLASWDIVLYATTQETKTLTASDASYSWGTGGDINTDRPVEFLDQTFIRRGDVDYPVRLVNQGVYNAISNKSITGLPEIIYFDPKYPLAYIYLYPSPDAADTLYLTSRKALSEITDSTQAISIPSELAAALKWNLSVELAPNYGVPITQVMALRAAETKGIVMARAFKYRMEPAKIDNVTGKNRVSSSNTSILSY